MIKIKKCLLTEIKVSIMFSRVKGVQDFLSYNLWKGVLRTVESHLSQHNFSEIQTPLLEYVSLFQRGLGYETDVVTKQMFLIEQKNDKDQLCLRPEATAGTMRAYLETKHEHTTPWNVFSFGPMFRYERPQRGRYRQFHQVNIESIGVTSVQYDAFFIQMLYKLFLETFGISEFALAVNFLGTPEDREQYKKALYKFLSDKSVCDTCQQRKETNLLRVLDCKSELCQEMYASAPILTDHLSEESAQEWQALQDQLHELSVTYTVNSRLVRGLDYYNKTVFEFVGMTLGAQDAFCGGGRYDGLAEQLGSKETVPAIGAAIGFERLLLLLDERAQNFALAESPLTVVISCAQEQNSLALLCADTVQRAGKTVQVLVDNLALKNKLKRANKMGAAYVILIGEEEQQSGTVTVKNMMTGKEERVTQDQVVDLLK